MLTCRDESRLILVDLLPCAAVGASGPQVLLSALYEVEKCGLRSCNVHTPFPKIGHLFLKLELTWTVTFSRRLAIA